MSANINVICDDDQLFRRPQHSALISPPHTLQCPNPHQETSPNEIHTPHRIHKLPPPPRPLHTVRLSHDLSNIHVHRHTTIQMRPRAPFHDLPLSNRAMPQSRRAHYDNHQHRPVLDRHRDAVGRMHASADLRRAPCQHCYCHAVPADVSGVVPEERCHGEEAAGGRVPEDCVRLLLWEFMVVL